MGLKFLSSSELPYHFTNEMSKTMNFLTYICIPMLYDMLMYFQSCHYFSHSYFIEVTITTSKILLSLGRYKILGCHNSVPQLHLVTFPSNLINIFENIIIFSLLTINGPHLHID